MFSDYVQGMIMSPKENLAYRIEKNTNIPDPFFQVRITGIVNDWYLFDQQVGSSRAKVSASCLLTPEVGDEVLVFVGKTNHYIMSVLERANSHQSVEIMFPAGARFNCLAGPLDVKAGAINLNASETVELSTELLSVKSSGTELRASRLDAWIGKIDAKAFSIELAANQISTVFGRLITRAKQSFRWIEGIDETRAGRVRIASADRIQMSSKHTSIRAEGYVKIDGKKIDLG